MTSPYTPNTGPQGGGYGGQMPPVGPVPPAPGAPGQPQMAPRPVSMPPPTSNTPLIVGLAVGALVVVLVVVGLLWFRLWRVPRTPSPGYNPGPAPANSVIKTQVIEECHSAVKQTMRSSIFTRDSATYERTDSNGDQHWIVSGRVTGASTSGMSGTFEWSCTATYFDKNGLVDAWSSVETTPVR